MEKKIYFGLAATTFKERFGNHKKDLNHKQHSKKSIKIYMIIKRCENTIQY